MNIVGTSGGNDNLTFKAGAEYLAGLAGNDTLNIGVQGLSDSQKMIGAFGGGGNDTYVLSKGSFVVIADSGGSDTIVLPYTMSELTAYLLTSPDAYHAIIDDDHYFVDAGGVAFIVKDFLGAGKLETVSLSDGYTLPFDTVWSQLKGAQLDTNTIANMEDVAAAKVNKFFNMQGFLNEAEQFNAKINMAGWFDSETYLDRKLAKTPGLTGEELEQIFADNWFLGPEGQYLHFEMYGQWEDVAPTPLFDADYYYRSKAANFFDIDIDQVTNSQANQMRDAIQNAGMNAWYHYIHYGTREGIDASASFNTNDYIDAKLAQMQQSNPAYTEAQLLDALAQANLSALGHYEAHGKDEGITLAGVQTYEAEAMVASAE